MRNLIKTLFLLSAPFMVSCIETPEIVEEKAVIDGWIDSDGFPTIIFTSSLSPGDNNHSISDLVIKWGKVTISDGTQTIILTGGPDKNLFPPYKYVTYKMIGEPGKTYKITADYKNLHAEAECEMLPPTPIKSIDINHIPDNDTLRSAQLRFITPQTVPAYYYITMREYETRDRFNPTMLGTFKATEPLKEVTIPLFHPKNQLSTDDFEPQLKVGEKMEINLCRVTKEVYEFWNEYDNAVLFGGSQFIDTSHSVTGNIRGGYGIWSAQGVSTTVIEVN